MLKTVEESSKEQNWFRIEILCNIINVFTVSFDQFNVSPAEKTVLINNKRIPPQPLVEN